MCHFLRRRTDAVLSGESLDRAFAGQVGLDKTDLEFGTVTLISACAHRLILRHPGVGGQFQSTYLSTGRGSLQSVTSSVFESSPLTAPAQDLLHLRSYA